MPGSYTADEQSAAKMMAAIADDPTELIVGVVTKVTSSTTAVVTHGLSGTPDFVIYSLQENATAGTITPTFSSSSTIVTFVVATAQSTWSVAYVIGYTA